MGIPVVETRWLISPAGKRAFADIELGHSTMDCGMNKSTINSVVPWQIVRVSPFFVTIAEGLAPRCLERYLGMSFLRSWPAGLTIGNVGSSRFPGVN